MENKYYYLFDIDYETMPWRIYSYTDDKEESTEIAKCYEEKDAKLVVNALNNQKL